MKLLLLYWAIMILFYLVADVFRKKSLTVPDRIIDGALNAVIFIMVFIMGLRMGANDEIIASLGTIGIQASVITFFVLAGSILSVTLLRKILGMDRHGIIGRTEKTQSEEKTMTEGIPEDTEEPEEKKGNGKITVLILLCVAAGMLMGYLCVPRIFDDTSVFQDMSGNWIVVGICILLGIVGFNFGLDGSVIQSLKKAGLKAILFPFAVIAGSIIAGAAYGLVSSLTVREAAAISAGFGWYTFAPGIISEAGHAVAGAVSFMHNVIRETLGIIIIPLVAEKLGYVEAAAVPGIAAMDVCLPVIKRSCNSETVVYAIYMGLVMSIVVPVLVPLFIG